MQWRLVVTLARMSDLLVMARGAHGVLVTLVIFTTVLARWVVAFTVIDLRSGVGGGCAG